MSPAAVVARNGISRHGACAMQIPNFSEAKRLHYRAPHSTHDHHPPTLGTPASSRQSPTIQTPHPNTRFSTQKTERLAMNSNDNVTHWSDIPEGTEHICFLEFPALVFTEQQIEFVKLCPHCAAIRSFFRDNEVDDALLNEPDYWDKADEDEVIHWLLTALFLNMDDNPVPSFLVPLIEEANSYEPVDGTIRRWRIEGGLPSSKRYSN
jgi:hypothetical protein